MSFFYNLDKVYLFFIGGLFVGGDLQLQMKGKGWLRGAKLGCKGWGVNNFFGGDVKK